jgi:hypothetical protein
VSASPSNLPEYAINSVNGVKALSLAFGGSWSYVGSGDATTNLLVDNYGGVFSVGDPTVGGTISLTMTAGNATTPAYTNIAVPLFNWNPQLEILNGSGLDALNGGVEVDAGQLSLIGNPFLPMKSQYGTIVGNFTMTGGVIGFIGSPTQATDGLTWGRFTVVGNVYWSGGQFNAGVDCKPGDPANANVWQIYGTLTVDTSRTSLPTIAPIPQYLPQGQKPKGLWDVITATAVVNKPAGGNPSVLQGWTLRPTVNQQGVTTGYGVQM